jgi:hypothetical protein
MMGLFRPQAFFDMPHQFWSLLVLILAPALGQAGLHYSAETPADLPARWRGFLLDHRAVRLVGTTPPAGEPIHVLREQYAEAVRKLESAAKKRPLSADEAADLGALHIRLGRPAKAIEVLRQAHRGHPEHFRVVANLGTAWQLHGDLTEAARALQEAVRLAPSRWKPYEDAHLKLVRLRQKEPKNARGLDDLFGVGPIDPTTRKKLPADDVAIAQQLALWLPSDGRLLWLLGELAHAHGDVRMAAAMLDGVVTEFALTSPDARERRKRYRAAADEIARLPDSDHARYRGDIVFRSPRPITRTLDAAVLPAIRADGVNPLPWPVLAETVVDQPFRPRFHNHLGQLDGKKVSMTGFMQPLTTDLNVFGFLLIEYPVGCWFCETPEPAGLLYVEVAGGTAVPVKRGRVKVEGTLKLNATDPEDFLYTLTGASVRDPD